MSTVAPNEVNPKFDFIWRGSKDNEISPGQEIDATFIKRKINLCLHGGKELYETVLISLNNASSNR